MVRRQPGIVIVVLLLAMLAMLLDVSPLRAHYLDMGDPGQCLLGQYIEPSAVLMIRHAEGTEPEVEIEKSPLYKIKTKINHNSGVYDLRLRVSGQSKSSLYVKPHDLNIQIDTNKALYKSDGKAGIYNAVMLFERPREGSYIVLGDKRSGIKGYNFYSSALLSGSDVAVLTIVPNNICDNVPSLISTIKDSEHFDEIFTLEIRFEGARQYRRLHLMTQAGSYEHEIISRSMQQYLDAVPIKPDLKMSSVDLNNDGHPEIISQIDGGGSLCRDDDCLTVILSGYLDKYVPVAAFFAREDIYVSSDLANSDQPEQKGTYQDLKIVTAGKVRTLSWGEDGYVVSGGAGADE